ncbi:hypothetical protein CVD28_13015 [Bacillus sp. M6-12]|uniref:hypothetical protein n=1 Tax=Bacillus sp. M6-12 TaxID=2054166 RepID=UPI000C767FC3|nr:hypothetical protein [Bacillus sp. M6-12]PLS17464.1 hypothetical protein CVD28_13015 [Bacillus sp. M6-12]
MHPTTIIDLFLIFLAALVIGLIAFLLPKECRKIAWGISCFIVLAGIIFYGTRPFIVEYQTKNATEKLVNHFRKLYPNDSWRITDTDEHRIQPVVNLHVIFESEPKIVYAYKVENEAIKQVGMWMLSGDPAEGSGMELRHNERGGNLQ